MESNIFWRRENSPCRPASKVTFVFVWKRLADHNWRRRQRALASRMKTLALNVDKTTKKSVHVEIVSSAGWEMVAEVRATVREKLWKVSVSVLRAKLALASWRHKCDF